MFDANLKDLYSRELVRLAASIPRTERLEDADASAGRRSPMCGSQVNVDIKLADGVITDFGQTVRACVLGQSSAALVGKHIVGTSAAELRQIAEQMRAMLQDGGDPPGGKWADLAMLEPAREFRNRHASILLPFDAVLAAISELGDTGDALNTSSGSGVSELTVSL